MRNALDRARAAAAQHAATTPHRRGPHPAAQYAPEIGNLFRDLRRHLRLSLPEVASRVGTRMEVIEALETGKIGRLPPWPETVRVVSAFTALARIEPGPILAALWARLEGPASSAAPSYAAPGYSAPDYSTAAQYAPRLERAPRFPGSSAFLASARAHAGTIPAALRALAPANAAANAAGAWHAISERALSLPRRATIAVVALALAAVTLTSVGIAGSRFPNSLASVGLVRTIQDAYLHLTAPTRGGLTWIEVDDPRERRGDRLDREP